RGGRPVSPPVLDSRTFEELRTAVHAAAARTAPEWQPDLGDAGDALVAVFAHYLEIVLERLNRVPDKNAVAFFDALGLGFLPPVVTRTAALTLHLPRAASAPAGARLDRRHPADPHRACRGRARVAPLAGVAAGNGA